MSDSVDINTNVSSESRDWVEHPLQNATAESYGRSLAAVSVTSSCGLFAGIASSVSTMYSDVVQGCLDKFTSFFSSHNVVFSSLETEIDNATTVATQLTQDNDLFSTLSYMFALDGLVEFFSGVYFDSLLFFVQFVGYFFVGFVSICVALIIFQLICKLIKICSLGFVDVT